MNGHPLSKRKRIQVLVILTIMCWATQTLLHQWGYGAEIVTPPQSVDSLPEYGAAEKFVPAPARFAPATLELRSEATIFGAEVRLKQVCRWSDVDAQTFLPVADLIVMRFEGRTPFKSIRLQDLRDILRDAHVSPAAIRFAGPLLCTVHRSDAEVKPADALQQWVDARQEKPAPQPAAAPAVPTMPIARAAAAALPGRHAPANLSDAPASPIRSLRQALTEDLSIRLGVPLEQLEIGFNPKDERILNLAEPQFRFNIEPTRIFNLGEVSWDVLMVHQTGTQKVPITATARAWQAQVVVREPLSAKQVIRATDVTERRILADRLPDEPLLTLSQAVGQEASRDLKPGVILTGRMVDAVPLAKNGQFVTITLNQGGVRIRTVGRAMEGGSFGQSIKVKNETTGDIYEVVLTAPQEGTIGTAPSVVTH